MIPKIKKNKKRNLISNKTLFYSGRDYLEAFEWLECIQPQIENKKKKKVFKSQYVLLPGFYRPWILTAAVNEGTGFC